MVKFRETAPFGERRSYGFHEGRDLIGDMGKATPIENLYDGVLLRITTPEMPDKNYGVKVSMSVNPKFVGGVNADVTLEYCHMHALTPFIKEIDKSSGASRFVKKGQVLGYMGNSGNCMTADGFGGWRTISKEEQASPTFLGGVHLHYHVKVRGKAEATALCEAIKEVYPKVKAIEQ